MLDEFGCKLVGPATNAPRGLRAHRQGVDRDSGPRPKSGRSGLPLPTRDKRRCALHLCDRLRFHRNTQGVATAADGAKRHASPSGVRCRSRSACRISNGRLWQYGRSLCVRLMSHLDETSAQRVTTILPNWPLFFRYRCTSTISSNLNIRSMTGLSAPRARPLVTYCTAAFRRASSPVTSRMLYPLTVASCGSSPTPASECHPRSVRRRSRRCPAGERNLGSKPRSCLGRSWSSP